MGQGVHLTHGSAPELVVHISIRGRQVEAGQEQADGNTFAANRSAIHDFKLGYGLTLVIQVASGAGAFATPDLKLHVLDFQPN